MKNYKPLMFAAVFVMLLSLFPLDVHGAEIGCTATVTPETAVIGEAVTALFSLTGYDTEENPINGIQVDITGVDSSVVSVEEKESLIVSDTAFSNTVTYSAKVKRVRLLYAELEDYLHAPCTDIFKVVFCINQDLTEPGVLKLPVTVMINSVDEEITRTFDLTIPYGPAGTPEEPDSQVAAEVSWGEMAFTYRDGIWDPQTHTYGAGSWTPDTPEGDRITVINKGSVSLTANFAYTRTRQEVAGSFTKQSLTLRETEAGFTQVKLEGKPSGTIDGQLGTVTVTIQKGGE